MRQFRPSDWLSVAAIVLALGSLIISAMVLGGLSNLRDGAKEAFESIGEVLEDMNGEAMDEEEDDGAMMEEEDDEEVETGDDDLSFEVDPVLVSVETRSAAASDVFDVDDLEARALECGNSHDRGYLDQVADAHANETMKEYTFTYLGDSQEPTSYVVTLLPNVTNYTDLDTFTYDFELCSAGGSYYPTDLSDSWLMFASSCGSGADDGSGLPVGCELAKEVVDDTYTLE